MKSKQETPVSEEPVDPVAKEPAGEAEPADKAEAADSVELAGEAEPADKAEAADSVELAGEAEPADKAEAAESARPAVGPENVEPPAAGDSAPAANPPATGKARSWRASRWLPQSTKGRVLGAVALVALIALVGGGGYWYQSTHLPDGVAFRVYGQDITVRQLDDDVQTTRALFGLQPPTDGPRLDAFRRDFAKAAAVAMIIDKAATDRHVAVADRQVSDVLARYITQFYGEGPAGRDRYVQALADQGTSEPKVLAELKRQMVLQQLSSQVTSDVTVSDQEVRQAFDQRRDQLATPEQREIHNIVVRDKSEADRIVAELNTGANFEQLARERSADGRTKDRGGDLGWISAQQLQKPYADVAFAAPIGAVFGPVQTQYGFNVGKVLQSQAPAPAEFDKISDQLRQLLIREKALAKWNDYLSGLIKDADIRYADLYRPADPDALPTAGQAAPPAAAQDGASGASAPQGGAPAPQGGVPAAPVPNQAPPR